MYVCQDTLGSGIEGIWKATLLMLRLKVFTGQQEYPWAGTMLQMDREIRRGPAHDANVEHGAKFLRGVHVGAHK